MGCNKFLEFGMLYFYGELGSTEKREFEKHLSKCEFCHAELNELKSISELYESLPKEEPSQVTLREILERAKRKEVKLRVPSIKIFQGFLRPAFAGIGVAIIFAIAGYFISQRPNPYLEWENGMHSEIEAIDGRIYDLHEETEIFGPVDISIEENIQGVKERIENLEKELQSLEL